MTDPARLYTPAEAGAVSGLGVKAVQNAIDKKVVELVSASETVAYRKTTARSKRLLNGEALVRLRVWRSVGDALPAERRRRLFHEMAARPKANSIEAGELLTVNVGEARRQVLRGLRDLDAAEAMIARDRGVMGGEPVFRGTRIPVYSVAAMLEAGASAGDLLSGYPKLTARMLDLAKVWAAAHPRRGRPKSLGDLSLTLKSSKRRPFGPDPLAIHAVAGFAEE